MVLSDLELNYRDLFHSISEYCKVRSISEAQMLQLGLHEDIYITRMHSSRMRTVCSSSRLSRGRGAVCLSACWETIPRTRHPPPLDQAPPRTRLPPRPDTNPGPVPPGPGTPPDQASSPVDRQTPVKT